MESMRVAPAMFPLGVIGFAGGLVMAGLTTEIYEELYDRTTWPSGSLVALKAVTTGIALAVVLWGAYRLRQHRLGSLLAALAVGTPFFFAFYEVDGTEAAVGMALAMAIPWTWLAMGEGTALVTPSRIAALLAVGVGIGQLELSPALWTLAAVSIIGLLSTPWIASERRGVTAAVAMAAWTVALAVTATPGALDQAAVGRLWPLGVGAVLLGVLTVVSFLQHLRPAAPATDPIADQP